MPIEYLVSNYFSEVSNLENSRLDYVHSEEYDHKRFKYLKNDKHLVKKMQFRDFDLAMHFKNTKVLGDIERLLLKKIIYDDTNPVNIILGTVGSGKTTLIKYIQKFISENYKELNFSMLTMIIDLNSVNREEDQFQNYQNDVYAKIIRQIKNKIYRLFDQPSLFKFWNEIPDLIDPNELYFALLYNVSDELSIKTSKGIKAQINSYIENKSFTDRFEFWLQLFSLACRSQEKPKLKCIIFLDNIDQHSGFLQSEIISKIQACCSYINNIQLYIPMRLISFGNLWSVGNQRSLMPHCSISIMRVVNNRLLKFIWELNYDKESILKNISSQKRASLTIIILDILRLLNTNCRYSKIISSLSGYSIRRAIFIVQILLNSEVFYQKYQWTIAKIRKEGSQHTVFKNIEGLDIKKAIEISRVNELLFFKEWHKERKHFDVTYTNITLESLYRTQDYIAIGNLFKVNNEISTLKIRIIKYLNLGTNLSIASLINYLKKFNYDIEDVINCLNELSDQAKRIIYYDGPKTIKNIHDLNAIRSNKVILTYTGERYLLNLLNDFDYQQHSLYNIQNLSTELKGVQRLNYNIQRINDIILNEVSEINYCRTRLFYNQTLERELKDILTLKIFKNFIIENIFKSIESLLGQHQNSKSYIGYLRDPMNTLESLVTIIQNCYDKNFETKSLSKEFTTKFRELKLKFEKVLKAITEK